MVSEALLIILALIGIGVIVVGIMNIVVMQRPRPSKIDDDSWRTDSWQWRGHNYSHLPIRPMIYA